MTDVTLVTAKLTTLRQHLSRMARRRSDSLDEFLSDEDRQDALALSLLVVLQEAADIALHMAADEGWGVASSYAGSFELLAQAGVIDRAIADQLGAMASLRNRIAHGSGSIDAERIWREVPAGIEAMRRFSAMVARHIGEH
jgi:uncharacterized protein YutE (UPF0331/DUF86 family)